MTQGVKDLISAIVEGDAASIDAAFNAEMATRVSSKLEDMRVSVAQNMFATEQVEEVSEETEEIEEEMDELDEDVKYIKRKDGKLHAVDDREGPIKNTHLAKDAAYVQTNLTKHLRKHAGLSPDSHVYFDDVDLVHGDKTVVSNAIHPKSKKTVGDLVTALKSHVAKHGE